MSLSETQQRWFRLRRSGLVEPFASPEAAAGALAGVQAQILTAAGMALGNRVTGLDWPILLDRLQNGRSLVKLWGQRGTLHLYPAADWRTICAALADQATWAARQARRDPARTQPYARAVVRLEKLLRKRGTLTREEARQANLGLDEPSLSSWGGIFTCLVRTGDACHVPSTTDQGRFAHRLHWLPDLPWPPMTIDEANCELVRRYLKAYGPARVQDIAYWRGTTIAHASRWVGQLGGELAEVQIDGVSRLAHADGLAELSDAPPPADEWPVRLLGRFDPMLLAHKDKSWLIEPGLLKRVWGAAGHVEGTILVHGRIAGTWRYDRTGAGLRITFRPFGRLSKTVREALEERAEAICRFFRQPRVK